MDREMRAQVSEADAYVPRLEIIRQLDNHVEEFDRLDAQQGIRIYRLLYKLRTCRGGAAVQPIEEALRDLERRMADDADDEAIETARQSCLDIIRSLG